MLKTPFNIYCQASVWLYITSWEVKNSELWKDDICRVDRCLVVWTKREFKDLGPSHKSVYWLFSLVHSHTHTHLCHSSHVQPSPLHSLSVSLCKLEFPSLQAKLKVTFSYSLLPVSSFLAEWKTVSCYTLNITPHWSLLQIRSDQCHCAVPSCFTINTGLFPLGYRAYQTQ